LAGYIPRWYSRPKTVIHPGTNRARRALTSFMRRTPLTTTPGADLIHGSLVPPECVPHTASRSAYPSPVPAHSRGQQTHTDRPRYMCSNRSHLIQCIAMPPNDKYVLSLPASDLNTTLAALLPSACAGCRSYICCWRRRSAANQPHAAGVIGRRTDTRTDTRRYIDPAPHAGSVNNTTASY